MARLVPDPPPVVKLLSLLLVSGVLLRAAPGSVPEPELLRSTYLGGGGPGYLSDSAQTVVRGPGGSLWVGGLTGSRNFPYTRRIGNEQDGDGSFVARYPADGGSPEFVVFFNRINLRSLAVDATGAAYLVGETQGEQPQPSSAQPAPGGNLDAFIAKLKPDGSALDYFTFLGGSQLDLALGVAVDGEGAAHVTGLTTSPDFPVTPGAAQGVIGGRFDAFAAKVAPDGQSFLYATYLGGAGSERGNAVAIDGGGRALIVGRTSSTNLPAATPEIRLGGTPARTDAFVARLSPTGTSIERVVRLGGENSDSALRVMLPSGGGPILFGTTDSEDWPAAGGVLPNGTRGNGDLFVLQLGPALDSMERSVILASDSPERSFALPYFGGFLVDGEASGNFSFELESGGLALGTDGSVLVTASTRTPRWPDTESIGGGGSDVLAARLSPDLSSLRWLRVLGGNEDDQGFGIADDGAGGAWVVGEAGRPVIPPYFPTTGGPAQPDFGGSISDAFLLRVGPAATVPSNDRLEGAIRLSGHLVTAPGRNGGASVDPAEPLHAGLGGGHSVWWTWTAPAAGRLAVDTAGSGFDTLLAVYIGESLSSLVAVASGDDSAGALTSAARFPVAAGVTYRIAVDGKEGATGRIALNLRFSAPANDDFADRIRVTGFPLELTGDTTGATVQRLDDLRVEGSVGGASVWWEWTSPILGPVAVTVEGGVFLPSLAVFTGDSMDTLMPVQSAGGPAFPGEETFREVTFQAMPGARYVIGLDGYFGSAGSYRLRLQTGAPPANDSFAQRGRLSGLYARIEGTNRRSTFERESGEPLLVLTNAVGDVQGPAAGNTVWWTWTAPESGRTRVALTHTTFDSRVAVYRGTAFGSIVRLAASDGQAGDDRNSEIRFEAEAGAEYQIQVDGGNYNGRSGTFVLTLVLDHPPKIRVGSLRLETDGSVSFEVEAVPGRPVRLEAGTDLRNWTEISSVMATGEPFRMVAPPGTPTHRLFRLSSPTEP